MSARESQEVSRFLDPKAEFFGDAPHDDEDVKPKEGFNFKEDSSQIDQVPGLFFTVL